MFLTPKTLEKVRGIGMVPIASKKQAVFFLKFLILNDETYIPYTSIKTLFCPPPFRHRNKKQKTDNELNIAILSCTIILGGLVPCTPYSVISLMGIFGYKDLMTLLWSAMSSLVCKTAGCMDPFLYAIKNPTF